MKISEKWLRSWVNPNISRSELIAQFNMAGLEVAAATPAAKPFSGVVVGYVQAVSKHPHNEKLNVCIVDIGKKIPLSIVCGASNVTTQQFVAVALIGAKLPQHPLIEKTEIHNVTSEGMLCSQEELGFADSSEGIWELPDGIALGSDLWQLLHLDDYILDIELTPNRGDCLSVAGLARELAVLNRCKTTPPEIKPVTSQVDDIVKVKLLSPIDCPHYVGRVIRDCNNQVKTPLWLQEQLRRSGLRSINAIVDVMNYVMLELGQPLHAFDLAFVEKNIEVRRAHNDEILVLLNGQEVKLDENILVIADAKQCLAMAGVMGGLHSSVTATTKNIFIESAYFNPVIIAGRARRYGFSSDAAYRFERGVDPQLQRNAVERATALLIEITKGKPGPVTEYIEKNDLPKSPNILLRKERIKRVLGVTIADNEIADILHYLGMTLVEHKEGWNVIAPSYRFDIVREIDLIEEIARIYGYQKIPQHCPTLPLTFISQPESRLTLSRLRNLYVDRGYQEVITYSFVSKQLQELLDPTHIALELSNPLSPEMAVMRSTIWSGLLTTLIYNQNRQQQRARLFEIGLRFVQEEQEIKQGLKCELKQELMIAGLLSGNALPEQWGVIPRAVDFFDMKNDLYALLTLTGKANDCRFEQKTQAALHPGQSCAIMLDEKVVGYCGALHPAISKVLGIDGPIYLFECKIEDLIDTLLPQYKPISKFPAIRRDLAFVVDQFISAQLLQDAIKMAAGEWLVGLQLFDVYQGKGIPEKQKSIALSLVFQHPDRTLVENEINDFTDGVINALKQQFNVILRN